MVTFRFIPARHIVKELSLKQWHHGYLGIALALIGALNSKTLFVVLGLILLVDDVVQHAVQYITQTEWHSPLHRLYAWVYARVALVRRVNNWLDTLFS